MLFFYLLMTISCCCLSWQRCLSWSTRAPYQRFGRQLMTTRTLVTSVRTQYTIDEPGLDSLILEKTVRKHVENLSVYLSAKPVADHTKDAFLLLQEQLKEVDRPLILDSGCGTGRSSQYLGTIYPDHIILGVDRSLARLQKNLIYRQQSTNNNVLLVRAELSDFWRLFLESPLGTVDKHYLLYPNPYPKKSRFQNRWYAHPSFPLLLQLGGKELVVRSNWKEYLEDFSKAASLVQEMDPTRHGPLTCETSHIIKLEPTTPWTNFEAKYFHVGENTFELLLRQQER